jgi:hypothetical protein
MMVSISKKWFAATLVAAIAAPAAQAHPLAESGFSSTRSDETTVAAGRISHAQSQSATIARGARERAAERSAADAVTAGFSNTRVVEMTVAAGHKPHAQPQSTAIARGARERAAERSGADAVSLASPSVASVSAEGFHLRDAGIGAAVTAGVLMLFGSLALIIGRARRRALYA